MPFSNDVNADQGIANKCIDCDLTGGNVIVPRVQLTFVCRLGELFTPSLSLPITFIDEKKLIKCLLLSITRQLENDNNQPLKLK